MTTRQVRLHLIRAQSEDDYTAVNTLWLGLVKAAQCFDGNEAKGRDKLLAALDHGDLRALLASEGVEQLLGLSPPIESILTYEGEEDWLDAEKASEMVECVRQLRTGDPLRAAVCLLWLLRRIRNRREHGFKTPDGPRDQEILAAARLCLEILCRASLPLLDGAQPEEVAPS